MSYKANDDNIYKEGTLIRARAHPDLELKIVKYLHRTYYCSVVGDSSLQNLVYFERELLPPPRSTYKR